MKKHFYEPFLFVGFDQSEYSKQETQMKTILLIMSVKVFCVTVSKRMKKMTGVKLL